MVTDKQISDSKDPSKEIKRFEEEAKKTGNKIFISDFDDPEYGKGAIVGDGPEQEKEQQRRKESEKRAHEKLEKWKEDNPDWHEQLRKWLDEKAKIYKEVEIDEEE